MANGEQHSKSECDEEFRADARSHQTVPQHEPREHNDQDHPRTVGDDLLWRSH